ncbi:MAG: UV DNA damage repair endonuclease UvsE [Intestinibacillus sp.]
MRIGYACIALGVPDSSMKKCLMQNADEARLREIIAHNLNALELLLRYNIKNSIFLFRISSDLIPFGSGSVNRLAWWELYGERFERIGAMIRDSGMRVSMHPGQYTVLNSESDAVAERAAADLTYHARVLDALGLDAAHKLILHIGGIYGDKSAAAARFAQRYAQLAPAIKKRLVIENDDRCYTIGDVLRLGRENHIPVVFDNLHHRLNPPPEGGSDVQWVNACRATWGADDGPQKIHYSQQARGQRRGNHSATICVREFAAFAETLNRPDLDIMLEVKDKNLSAIKCRNCMGGEPHAEALEQEWSRYQYLVLEHSPELYQQIGGFLKSGDSYDPFGFYQLLEAALQTPLTPGSFLNGVLHIWDCFKEMATEQEKAAFRRAVEELQFSEAAVKALKNRLYRLAVKYRREDLLQSYYFLF